MWYHLKHTSQTCALNKDLLDSHTLSNENQSTSTTTNQEFYIFLKQQRNLIISPLVNLILTFHLNTFKILNQIMKAQCLLIKLPIESNLYHTTSDSSLLSKIKMIIITSFLIVPSSFILKKLFLHLLNLENVKYHFHISSLLLLMHFHKSNLVMKTQMVMGH